MTSTATTIHLTATVVRVGKRLIARIPKEESKERFPSRGQIFVKGTINGVNFSTVLEPDGYWSHWLNIDEELQSELSVTAGDAAVLEVVTSKDWPEPVLPADVASALADAPQKVKTKWQDITAMARWEWIRWINATAVSGTRAVRIEKTISKLNGSHRRPCCFNLAACTDPDLSKSGRLIES